MTTEEIKALQRELGVTPDGVIGPETRAAAEAKINEQAELFGEDTSVFAGTDLADVVNTTGLVSGVTTNLSETLDTSITSDDETLTAAEQETSNAQLELLNLQRKTNNLIDEFIRQSSDFGRYTPSSVDEQFDEADQEYTPTSRDLKSLYPWLTDTLITILIDGEGGYVETGKIDIALANMRASEDYKKTFPGIAREDGTLRMTESEYYETQDVMKDTLRTYNLNPEVFAEDISQAIAGDVSAKEFAQRLEFGYSQIVNNIPAVKEVYFREYGLDLSDEALFGMFVSPNVAESVLQNQLLVSSIIAEAEAAGASLTKEGALAFAQAGVSQERAREIYGQVAQLEPGLSGMTTTAIARGIAGLDTDALAQIRNLQARRASVSSAELGAATTQAGEVVGLTEA